MWGGDCGTCGKRPLCCRFVQDADSYAVLGVRTVLFAGTPGPFYDDTTREFAKEVLSGFDLVVNREPTSSENLKKWDFELAKVRDFACPAFLYQSESETVVSRIIKDENIFQRDHRKIVGFYNRRI